MEPLPYANRSLERLTWPDGESAVISHNDRVLFAADYKIAAEWAVKREIVPGWSKQKLGRPRLPFKRHIACPLCKSGGHTK